MVRIESLVALNHSIKMFESNVFHLWALLQHSAVCIAQINVNLPDLRHSFQNNMSELNAYHTTSIVGICPNLGEIGH